MKLTFEQSGGFVGVRRKAVIESEHLPKRLREGAERLWTVSEPVPGGAGRDLARYQIEIEAGGNRRSIRFDDLTVPAELADLVAYLAEKSAPG
jgi:hypothetical protein